MAQYKVRSGQNIYDVALTLYGSVEGIFDLLASNRWLTMETQLSYGMVLDYHDEFAVNKSNVIWLKDNNVLVKNGEHIYYPIDIEKFVETHIKTYHKQVYQSLQLMSTDEQNMYWESLYTPRLVIQQQDYTSNIVLKMKPDTHLIVDWGDYNDPQVIEGTSEQEVEHCYKSSGKHIITFYGDFEFEKLDFRELNGIYYPLGIIYADEFYSHLKIDDLSKLIIRK